jgi:hypothetical protein
MSTRRFVAAIAVMSAVFLAAPMLAARQAAPSKVKVVAFGGFLGFVDGLYELPAGAHDPTAAGPAGGLVGVRRQLGKKDPAYQDALRLVTGNNMPRYAGDSEKPTRLPPTSASHPFWPLLASLAPGAVAIGTEDIAHALSEVDGASHLAQLTQKPPVPFVASNVFIKSKARGMNAVHQGAYHLEVSADESLELLRRLTIGCDARCASDENATLEDLGLIGKPAAAGIMHVRATPEADNQHWTIDLKAAPLRPGRQYRLSIHGVVFTFQTVAALTPDADGLPVITRTEAGVTYRVLAFVQPDVLTQFTVQQRQWKRGARNAAACPADTCEVVILPPSATWTSLAPRVPHGPNDGVLTAMLDLEDDATLELLQLSPAFRVVTLAPGTTLLGRAAPEETRKDLGGDLGYNAIVDTTPRPEFSGLTRVLMRPEWLGETIHTFEADPGVLKDSTGKDALMTLTNPKTAMEFVAGAPLRAELSAGMLQYFVTDGRETIKVGGRYKAYPRYDAKGMVFDSIPIRDLWTNSQSMTAFLLYLVRKNTKADVAVLDDLAVDDSIPSWLEVELSHRPIEYLSQFILERAMFRPSRVVRVTVAGSQLAAYLGKVVAAAKSFDSRVFMSGIGSAGGAVNRIDSDTLKINEREIDAGHFYSIALPQRYAVAMKESREERPLELSKLMEEADRALASAAATGSGLMCVTRAENDPDCPIEDVRPAVADDVPAGSLAIELERSHASRARSVFALGKASVEASGRRSNETSDLALSAVPEDGRDGTKYKNIAFAAQLEPGISSRRGVSISFPTEAAYSHKQVGADPVKETYPSNSWSTAAKLAKTFHSVPRLHSVYGSAGFESNFIRTTKAVSTATSTAAPVIAGSGPSATTLTTTTSIKLTSTEFPRPAKDFTITAGAQFEDVGKDAAAKLTGMKISYTKVRRQNDLVGLTASGREITADDLAADSAQAIINKLFKATPDIVKNDPTVIYKFDVTRFSRMDAAATGSLALRKDKTHATSISLENKYRWYLPGGTKRLIAARHTLESKLKVSTVVFGRVELAPYLNAFWLKLRNDGRTFQLFEYGMKLQFPLFASAGPGHARR